MATRSGGWTSYSGSGNRMRLESQIDQSPSSVGSGTSSVSLRLRIWVRVRYTAFDSSNTFKVSGSWPSRNTSVSISLGSHGQRALLYDETITVSTSYAGSVSRSFSSTLSGINAAPGTASLSWSYSVGRRPYSSPNAPTGVSASRSSDSRVNVSWSRNATTARPYTYQRVQKSTYTGTEWGNWGTSGKLSSGATSYTSTSIAPNNAYRFRVIAYNSAGSGTSSVSGTIRTTPAAPTSVRAKKLSGGDIRVSWSREHPFGSTHYLVEGRAGSGSWTQLGTASGESFTHVDPDPSSPWSYRVRARVTAPQTLTGPYSAASNTVQLLAAPNAPTLLSPSGTLDRDEDIPFTWQHNSVDTTDQTAYEFRLRSVGGSWSVVSDTTGEESAVTPALGVSGDFEWQVRTKGEYPSYSPWSPVSSFSLAAEPTVAINEPVDPLPVSRATLVVGYANDDGSPQARVRAELLHDGSVLESLSWTGTGDTGEFRARLDDATEYTVRARVQAGSGLWSDWDQVTFTTDFPIPVAYVPEGEWDRETGAVSLFGVPVEVTDVYEWTGAPNDSTSTRTIDDGETTTVITNTFTNPNMTGSGDVVVWENLVLNPRLEDDSTNWYSSPGSGGTASISRVGDYLPFFQPHQITHFARQVYSVAPQPGGVSLLMTHTASGVTPGETLHVSAYTRPHQTAEMVLYVGWYAGGSWHSNGEVGSRESVGAWSWARLEGEVAVPSGVDEVRVGVRRVTLPGVGSAFDVTCVLAGSPGPFFDETHSPDPDLRAESRPGGGAQLVGQQVAGLTPTGGVAIVSNQWGKRGGTSGRLLNTTGDPMSATITGGSAAGKAVVWQENVDQPVTLADPSVLPGPATLGESTRYDLLSLFPVEYDGTPFSGSTPSRVDADTVTYQRRDPGGEWVTIAESVDPATSITDPTPALGDVEYRAITETLLPSANTGEPVVVGWVHSGSGDPIYVNGGAGFGQVCTARGNTITDDPDIFETGHYFEGRRLPVAFFDPVSESNSISFTGNILSDDVSTRGEWVDLLRTRDIVCYRDCQGRKLFGRLRVGFSTQNGYTTLNLGVEERDHDETLSATVGDGGGVEE